MFIRHPLNVDVCLRVRARVRVFFFIILPCVSAFSHLQLFFYSCIESLLTCARHSVAGS